MTKPSPSRSDRDLQDAVISYLADANLRTAVPGLLPLSPPQAERAGRFARFLARRYYRDRMARSFRYSRLFAPPAECVVDTPAFDGFLSECVLGSLASAERAGNLALDHFQGWPEPGPWWSELLHYERAFFLQAATAESGASRPLPHPSPSARCCRFSWNLPRLLLRLKAGETLGDDLRQGVTLLFSRTRPGRIYVAEITDSAAAVFRAAQAGCDPAQIVRATLLPVATVQQTLNALAQVGALVTSS